MASADWLAKVSSSSITSGGKVAGAAAADHQHTDHLVAGDHRDGEHRSPAVLEDGVQELVALDRGEVGNLEGLVGERGLADQARLAVNDDVPQSLPQGSGCSPYLPRTWNESVASSYSRIDPPSVLSVMSPKPRLVSRTALVTMRSRTSSRSRLEPTASSTSRRASSCSTLSDSSAPRDSSARIRSTWRSTIAALHGELLEELTFPVIERRDIGAPHRQHADDLVLQDHRRRQQRAKTGEPLQVQATVVGVGEHVGDLDGALVLGRAADGRQAIARDRMSHQVSAVLLRRLAGDARETEQVSVANEQLGGGRSAQSRGVLEHGVQDRAGVRHVAAERRENLSARRQLLARVMQLPVLAGHVPSLFGLG